jgi:hypothetical protein
MILKFKKNEKLSKFLNILFNIIISIIWFIIVFFCGFFQSGNFSVAFLSLLSIFLLLNFTRNGSSLLVPFFWLSFFLANTIGFLGFDPVPMFVKKN